MFVFSKFRKFIMDSFSKAFLLAQVALTAALICAAQTTNSSSNYTTNSSSNYSYDITKSLSSCITNLFHKMEPEQVDKFINKMENYDSRNFEFEITYDKEPFHNKLFFSMINITGSRHIINFDRPHIHCQFSDKKIIISSSKCLFELVTRVGGSKDKIYSNFEPVLYLLNMTLTVTRLPKGINEIDKFIVNYTYDRMTFCYKRYTSFIEQLTSPQKKDLEDQFKKAVPSLLLDNIGHNDKFPLALDENFLSQPQNHIKSSHPQFLEHEQQHYVFIPNVFLYWFNLRNVTIRGLWNFHSLNANRTLSKGTSTLVVKNIRGSMTLDYGCEIEKPMELNFIADTIFISADYEVNRTNVEARDYHVIRTAVDTPVTNRQAAVIMQQIESAIASTMLPWMEAWKNSNQTSSEYDMENPLEKMFAQTTEKPDSKSIKQLLNKWIPFNES